MGSSVHFVPVRRHAALLRQRLVERALQGNPALIILRGGSGSGKTVLATQIAEEFAAPGAPAVWVRLEPDEGGVAAVWQRVLRALVDVSVFPQDSLAARLDEGGLSTVNPGDIVRAMAELTAPLMIVLDRANYQPGHEDSGELESSLLAALEATPHLTILLSTRQAHPELTSAAARTRVPVRELSGEEMVLTAEEIEELVVMCLPHLDAGQRVPIVRSVHEQSRGWPLAAHALVIERDDPSYASRMTTKGVFIEELVDHALRASTPDVQAALCASALFEEVSVEVFARMMEIPESEVARLLDGGLEASFGYWDDESGMRWFRHHELVREVLESRAEAILGPERLQAICVRAAVAFRKERSYLAIQAAIRGEAWGLLSDILVQLPNFNLSRGRPATWLKDIPSSVRHRYPVLAMFALIDEYARPSGRFGQMVAGFKLLAGRTLATESAKAGSSGIVAAGMRMISARLSGNEKLASAMADRVQETVGQLSDSDLAEYQPPVDTATIQAAVTLMHVGRMNDVEPLLAPVVQWRDRARPGTTAHAIAITAWSAAWRGELADARERIADAAHFEIPVGWHDAYIGAGYRLACAIDELERDDPDQAETHVDALAAHEATIEHWPFLTVVRALIAESRSGPAEGLATLEYQMAQHRGTSAPLATSRRMLGALRHRLQWHSGMVLPRATVRGAGRGGHNQGAVFAALSRGENESAAALAQKLLGEPAAVGNPRLRAELLLLHAEGARRSGQETVAAAAARKSAMLLEDHGLTLPMRVIPRNAAMALAALAPELRVDHSSSGSVREVRSLTAAELRAFRSVVTEGSISAAAGVLFLSPETVKSHMKQVHRKLGASNRAEAIRIAGEARMFDDHD